jgi:hypothetical protein
MAKKIIISTTNAPNPTTSPIAGLVRFPTNQPRTKQGRMKQTKK